MSGAFLFIFTLFWSGMVLLFDGFMAHGIYKQLESRNYPSVTGTITHSEVTSHRGSKGGTSYTAVIHYNYKIGGQAFEGSKLRFGMTSSSSTSARATVNAHPVGSTAQVFYNPANPQESLLSPGVMGSDFMIALFLTPFNMVMFGFWIWLGSWLRERFFKPVAGGVKIIADGMTTRIRLPQFPAVAWGLATTGGLGFISIFAVGIGTNMAPPIPLVLSAIAIVYACGLVVFLWQWRKIASGIDDLIVNESSQSLELPLTFGRKQRVTVNAANIKSLFVEKIEHRSSKGGISYTYAPTLYLQETEPATQKLADWSDKLKADEFAEWLRKQLGPGISATAVVADADEFSSSSAAQAPIAELRPDENSKIKVTDGSNGREFYFPAARNIGTALFATLFWLIFAGIAVAAYHFHAPILFPVAFGLIGVLMCFGVFSLWFKTSRVTIDSTRVSATNGYLFFTRTRQFSTGDVARFAAVAGMQSGSKIFYNLKLIKRNDDESRQAGQAQFQQPGQLSPLLQQRFKNLGGVTIASGIGSAAEANWLVQEMSRALGHGE